MRTRMNVTSSALFVAALLCPIAALASVSGGVQIQTPTNIFTYASEAPDAHVFSVGGAEGTVQYRNTPACVGLACGIDGPAVGAYLSAGDPVTRDIFASVQYTFNVVGDPGFIPILVLGQYAVVDPFEFPDRSGGTAATSVVQIRGAQGRLFNFQSLCYNYDPVNNEQAPAANCGTGVFQGSFMASAGTAVSVQLSATVVRLIDNSQFPYDAGRPAASAYLDPYFEIDPTWAAVHPGYSLTFDSGVGNGMPDGIGATTPVPEPETLALIAGGLVMLTVKRRRSARRFAAS
jgi:hypothetical protein